MEDRFCFGVFPDGAIQTLDGVSSVDDPSDLLGVIKVSCKLVPVFSPGFEGISVFAAPFPGKLIKSIICHRMVDCAVDVL